MTTFTSEDRENSSPPHIVDNGSSVGAGLYTIPIQIQPPPPPVIGWWVLPGGNGLTRIKFSAHKQPRWLTKVMMKYVFEWEWEDDLQK